MTDKFSGWTVTQILLNILVIIMIGVGGWHINLTMEMVRNVNVVTNAITRLETNIETNEKYHLALNDTLNAMCSTLTALSISVAQLPKEVPPIWFRQQVEANTRDITLLKDTSYGYRDYMSGKKHK